MNVYVKKKQIDISQIARIAIQNDAIDTIKFYLPKTYEGVDLTTFSWYLVYEYPDKTGGTLLLDTSVGSDYIEAEKSLIETAITGNLKIQLLAVNESQRFQTDPTSITIRPTLNPSSLTDVTIWEEYLTIYQAILLETETARDEILLDAGFIAVSNDLLGYNTIGQVASDLTDVGIVAGISTDVSNVSAIKDDVSDVSLIKDDVSVVADAATDIGIVATDLAFGIASKIKIVSDSIADVTTVAGIQTQVTALGALVDEMVALYAIRADITEVSLIDDAVSALALLTTQITALGARTTELDALYAEIDQIATKATVASVDAVKGTGWNNENLVDHEGRLDTLEGADTVSGSVAKTVKDVVDPVSTELETVKVKTTENDLAIQAIQRDQTLANQSEAKITTSDYGIVALPKNATGTLKMKREGLTATNSFQSSSFVTTTESGITYTKINNLTWNINGTASSENTKSIYPNANLIDGHVYYFNRYTNCDGQLSMRAIGMFSQTLDLDVVFTAVSSTNNILFLHSASAVINNVTIKPLLIDLTQTFGAGNEPTADQCKKIFPSYFADTQNVPITGRYRGRDLDGVTTHDLYLTAPEGRSVQGIKDSVEVSDGVLVHVQRISTSVAVSSGVAVNVTNYPLAKTGGNFRVELTAGGVQIGVIGTDSTSGAGTLTYELATPITTPIDSDGSLPAGASVYWEPAIPDVGIYTDKFDILDTDHPISSIDKLYKVDFATGVPTLLTDAVVAGDGLSFTSASLSDGDLVNVIYFYSVANPEGLTTVEYLNSNVVIADTNNGKYYKYKPVITNGAITSWTVTEVV